MPPESRHKFVQYYEQGELLSPEIPGCALAMLALNAPREWSGDFVAWNEERIQALVVQHG